MSSKLQGAEGLAEQLRRLHAIAATSDEETGRVISEIADAVERAALAKHIRDVGLAELCEVGLNGFGLQLFVESIANLQKGQVFKPMSFRFRGIKVTLEQDGELDLRHH